jgi:putative iron-regulated protein
LLNLRENPTEANLEAAKKAWLSAREPYGQTEVYRFRLSPIDSTDYQNEDGPEGAINAWPLGEALIDYVQVTVQSPDFDTDQIGVGSNTLFNTPLDDAGENTSGSGVVAGNHTGNNIIAMTSIDLEDPDFLSNSEAGDGRDVISGYHAIEFLLWGQDLNSVAATTDGTDRDEAVKTNVFDHGGQRPITDFQPGYGGEVAYDGNNLAHRRHKFLEVVIDQLISDLETVRDGWQDGVENNYRDQFTRVANQTEARQKIAEILSGMGTLSQGELAGERMNISFAGNSQEDEHSCFSDNTHRDIWLNAEGVSNSYYGEYAGYNSNPWQDTSDDATDNAVLASNGAYGIDDFLTDEGLTELHGRVVAALDTTEQAYTSIDTEARAGSPVDVQIMTANAGLDTPMADTMLGLHAQAALITEAAQALGINSDVVDPEGTACDTSMPLEECPEA